MGDHADDLEIREELHLAHIRGQCGGPDVCHWCDEEESDEEDEEDEEEDHD